MFDFIFSIRPSRHFVKIAAKIAEIIESNKYFSGNVFLTAG
jgi:hypothetical protein